MRKLIFAGLALSAAFTAPPRAEALGYDAEWCRVGRDVGGNECIFHTFEQCAASTERLNGGNCTPNPYFRGGSTPAAVRGARAKAGHDRVPQHKPRRNDANR